VVAWLADDSSGGEFAVATTNQLRLSCAFGILPTSTSSGESPFGDHHRPINKKSLECVGFGFVGRKDASGESLIMASTAPPRIRAIPSPKPKVKSSKGKPRSEEEIEFLDMAVDHLKSMSAEEYKVASEKLETIGNKARACF
jgi:hypothetical protein